MESTVRKWTGELTINSISPAFTMQYWTLRSTASHNARPHMWAMTS